MGMRRKRTVGRARFTNMTAGGTGSGKRMRWESWWRKEGITFGMSQSSGQMGLGTARRWNIPWMDGYGRCGDGGILDGKRMQFRVTQGKTRTSKVILVKTLQAKAL